MASVRLLRWLGAVRRLRQRVQTHQITENEQ